MYPTVTVPYLAVTLRSYTLFLILAAVLCYLAGPLIAGAIEGTPRHTTRRSLMALGGVAVLGAHAFYALDHFDAMYDDPLLILRFWSGLYAPGAIVALAVAMPTMARHCGVPTGTLADTLTPIVALGIALSRIACFMNGCCVGTSCRYWWCATFPHQSGPTHPLQLYFALSATLAAAFTCWLSPRKHYNGQVALVGIGIFAVTTAALETLRAANPAVQLSAIPPARQSAALALMVAALLALLYAESTRRRRLRDKRLLTQHSRQQ